MAFTIEFDNEFEYRMPHTTTCSKSGSGPWLASMAMYSNCMRLIPAEGITITDLKNHAHTDKLVLPGMLRWGYIRIEDDVVWPTVKGRFSQEVWRSLYLVIEQRWEERFGKHEIVQLKSALGALLLQFESELPEYLPVAGYGMFAHVLPHPGRVSPSQALAVLLSQVLLAFTLDFEKDWHLSLAMCANILRVLGYDGVRVRDIPRLSGVSKEAISMATGFLQTGEYITIEPDAEGARTKLVRLTRKGLLAQSAYLHRLGTIEEGWQMRYGADAVRNLREALEPLNADRLFAAIIPYPDGWRAKVRKPETLPHHPMVLHRGGYPDGS